MSVALCSNECFDQRPTWKPEEIQLDDGRTLVLEYT